MGQTSVSEPPYVPRRFEADDLFSSLSHETFICSFVKWHQFSKLKKTDGEAQPVGSTQSTKVIKQFRAGTHSFLEYNNGVALPTFFLQRIKSIKKIKHH